MNGDGNYTPFHITANFTGEDNGKYLFYATFAPISDEAMSIQEMLPVALSTITANIDDMTYIKDKDLRYICVSQSIADLTGDKNPRDFIGKTAKDMFSAEFALKADDDDRNVIETGVPVKRLLERIPTADGSIRLARTSKFPLLDSHGNAVGVYCVSHDITTQKEKESQLELLTASIPGGIAAYSMTDKRFSVLYFNDGFYAYS